MRLCPKKNYDTNQLEPGLFQMLDGTNVICDETGILPGKIGGNGVYNIRALAELIEDQKVVYDFQYMQQDFPLSASVLILSDDSRSMIKNSIWIPVEAAENNFGIEENKFNQIMADQELLMNFRKYFLLLNHFSDLTLQNYHVDSACSEFAQTFFINKRKDE
jgi:hypothetical protein